MQRVINNLERLELPTVALIQGHCLGLAMEMSLACDIRIATEDARMGLPGGYPYTGGVYPYRRLGEDPTRMFAGEGTPERTNRRFHLLARGQPAVRLSTAFDSVTLYGEDPHTRPDIYGKVGNSGVSIATVDDMKKLYSGFDLCAPNTSVSMTINGPAAIIWAFYIAAAEAQGVPLEINAYGFRKAWVETPEESRTFLSTKIGLSDAQLADIVANYSGLVTLVDRWVGQLLEALAGMPVQTWNLKSQAPEVRNIGPVAQDFNGDGRADLGGDGSGTWSHQSQLGQDGLCRGTGRG